MHILLKPGIWPMYGKSAVSTEACTVSIPKCRPQILRALCIDAILPVKSGPNIMGFSQESPVPAFIHIPSKEASL